MRYFDSTWKNCPIEKERQSDEIEDKNQIKNETLQLPSTPTSTQITNPDSSSESSLIKYKVSVKYPFPDVCISQKTVYHFSGRIGFNHNSNKWLVGRHTFATLAFTHGNDIYTVLKLLGHKHVKVTKIYAKLIDNKKDEPIGKLPII